MKQKMLEHESVYKNQVFELQHLYRVQRNRMDDIRKREQYEDRTRHETSSSSNALPSQMTPDYAHRQNSSRFLFTNSACSSPPSSNPEFIRSSASDVYKGKAVQDARMSFKNCASPNNYEPRPTKSRKVIDLELPADTYVDVDEDQCHNRTTCDTEEKLFPSQWEKKAMFLETHSESNSRLRKPYALADLNEPPEAEEPTADPPFDVLGVHRREILTKVPNPSEDVSWKTKHLNFNPAQSSSGYSAGNGQNWFSSALKAERNKDNGRTIQQTNQSERLYRPVQLGYENHQRSRVFPHLVMEDSLLAKQNNDSIMYGKSNFRSSFGNPGALTSPQPSYAYSSNLVNSWNLSSEKSGNHLSQKPMSAQITPFPNSESLSKSSQSLAQVNDFHRVWNRNAIPSSRSSFQSETPVINGSYHGSSSGRYKEVPTHFSKVGKIDYGSGSCMDNASSSSFLKAMSPIDLNSKAELDLNVVPNDISNELLTWQGEAKQEGSLSPVPWLMASASNNKAVLRSRNGIDKLKCEQDQHEVCNRHEVSNMFDHQSCLTSTSSNIDVTRGKEKVISGVPIFQAPLSREQEIDSGKKKLPFDINVAFEEFDSTSTTKEVIEPERIRSQGIRNMFDLNSCVTEDEIPSWTTSLTNSSVTNNNNLKKGERCLIIDLEAAPADMEGEEEGSCSVPDEQSMLKVAMEAAEAIVAMSVSSPSAPKEQIENALGWFADVICSSFEDVEMCPDRKTDCLFSDSDSFEEINIRLIPCSVEEYFPDPPDFEFLAVEEACGGGPTFGTGGQTTRRTRRGRQKRDFQRDILPGITSLARNEITEDIQTFGGLMRATGYVWNCGGGRKGNGSGRGRKRKQVVQVPPVVNAAAVNAGAAPLTPEKQQMMNNDEVMTVEDRSLTSWGKTTRRPRRQRSGPISR